MFKKTKLNSDYDKVKVKNTIRMLFFTFCILGIFVYIFKEQGLKVIGVISIMFVFVLIGNMLGNVKSKHKINKIDKNAIKGNPYIYYRDLPNDYGIGVASLSVDSFIENEKDIVAVILDLCARRYLKLEKIENKYIVTVLKDIDNGLLDNEKYIMSLIINDDIKNINYKEWFNYTLGDSKRLGLLEERKQETIKYDLSYKNHSKRVLIVSYCISILSIIITFLSLKSEYESVIPVISISALNGVILFFIIYIGYILLNSLFVAVTLPFKTINTYKKAKYQKNMNNNLIRTQKGNIEYQKLCSFKAFLNDFGVFAIKSPGEIVLWDRYLAFAQVFGLADNIMKTGYKELIENSSFKIDNINNIHLTNIRLNKQEV